MKCSLLLSTLLVSAGCQGANPLEINVSHLPIIGGTTDRNDPGVVALYAVDGAHPNNGGALCTAEVIAPTVLLTAAHCTITDEIGPNAVFYVIDGYDLQQATPMNLDVTELHHDPAFDIDHPENGHDIGVAILSAPIGIVSLPFNRQPLSRSMLNGSVRLVGYGESNGTRGTGAGTKRQVTTTLADFDSMLLQVGGPGQNTCNGDSGGPAFMTIGGVETIVGVTSFGDETCAQSGFDTRVDTYTAFIDQYSGNTCTPQCTAKSCGPDGCGGTCGSCAIGSMCTAAGQCMTQPMSDPCDRTNGFETEPNDTSRTASALCASGTIRGMLAPSDQDWFIFQISAEESYTLTLSQRSPELQLSLYKLLDGVMTWLGDATDPHSTADESLSLHASSAGTYFVRVAGTTASQPNYVLKLQAR